MFEILFYFFLLFSSQFSFSFYFLHRMLHFPPFLYIFPSFQFQPTFSHSFQSTVTGTPPIDYLHLQKHKKQKEENTKSSCFLNSGKNSQIAFFFSLKKSFSENTKSKNHPLSQTCFQCFLFSRIIFKNQKQFLKTTTKQALNFSILFTIYL